VYETTIEQYIGSACTTQAGPPPYQTWLGKACIVGKIQTHHTWHLEVRVVYVQRKHRQGDGERRLTEWTSICLRVCLWQPERQDLWHTKSIRHNCEKMMDDHEEEVNAAYSRQGLTLVYFSAQLERFVWDRGCA